MAGPLTAGARTAALAGEVVELAAAWFGRGGAVVSGGAGARAIESKTVSATTALKAALARRKRRRSASEKCKRGPFWSAAVANVHMYVDTTTADWADMEYRAEPASVL